jgi:hypothetical protein
MKTWIGRSAVAALVLAALQLSSGALLQRGTPSAPGWLPFALLGDALVALVATRLALGVHGAGWRRGLLVFAVVYGIQATNLVEALVFVSDVPVGRLLLQQLVVTVLYAGFLSRWAAPGAERERAGERPVPGRWGRAGRVLFCDLLYLLLYITAGLAISPWIAGYYASRPLPAPGTVLTLQLALRGPVLIGIVLLVTRAVGRGRLESALWAGLTLSIVGGIAPLIVPNPYLPDAVRYPHLAEVGISSLVFGLFTGWFLGAAPAGRKPSATGAGPVRAAA